SKQEVAPRFSSPIVTEIVPLGTFYPAEDYHQNYYRQHPENPYCQVIIAPKLQKLNF
ncbi:MAG: peptide-methionine (S)-S-oxide reductase, partial [SAR324 cluster bacterium]|nr:peptide-methionine (S)-S-oxide reductase [SAR324 cluster bacterium]